jgi:hypothetical protein
MSKRMPQDNQKSSYTWVEKNIYKTGKSYRVRVGEFSAYAPTRQKARKARTLLRLSNKGEKIFT